MNLCSNFDICKNFVESRMYCIDCSYKKRKKYKDDIECPICLEVKQHGIANNCEHYICIDCFNKCHPRFEEGSYRDYCNKLIETNNLRLCPICRQ
jgi:hypothetical protein